MPPAPILFLCKKVEFLSLLHEGSAQLLIIEIAVGFKQKNNAKPFDFKDPQNCF